VSGENSGCFSLEALLLLPPRSGGVILILGVILNTVLFLLLCRDAMRRRVARSMRQPYVFALRAVFWRVTAFRTPEGVSDEDVCLSRVRVDVLRHILAFLAP